MWGGGGNVRKIGDLPLVPRRSHVEYGDGAGDGSEGIWRDLPNDALDEAWEKLIDEHIIPVTKEDILAMRKDPDVVAKLPEEFWVDGEERYVAKASAFHNLHCLDYLRRTLYKDHYWPNGTDSVPFHDTHVSHCVMVLMEHLTCAPDPGVFLFRWLDEFQIPISDVNIWRKCWDFQAVLDGYQDISLRDLSEFDLKKPAGAKSLPAPEYMLKVGKEFHKNNPEWPPEGWVDDGHRDIYDLDQSDQRVLKRVLKTA
ncbi:hypothetical protein F5883DRAFT_521273 [Diaporthe sp. PMI_573]|nr:hypothetical protein F5883DRAFT_521273 [Diaporthaceae sp. PMI_573]